MKNPEEAVHSFCPWQIRKVLDIYHPNFEFQDASYEEFGYGATEIRITN